MADSIWWGDGGVEGTRAKRKRGVGYKCVMRSGLQMARAYTVSMVGRGLLRSSAYMLMIMPGVQKPHCVPWALASSSYTVELMGKARLT